MPVVAFGRPTDVKSILAAVKDRLVVQTGIAANWIFPTLAEDNEVTKSPPSKTFVTIKPQRFRPEKPIVAGGSEAAFRGTLGVHLWHSLYTDQNLRDADFLTKDPEGILTKWLKILGALHLYYPPDGADETGSILIEPMREADGFSFPDRKPPGWGRMDSAWEIFFVHKQS